MSTTPFSRDSALQTWQRLSHTRPIETVVRLSLGLPGALVLVSLSLWLVVYGLKQGS